MVINYVLYRSSSTRTRTEQPTRQRFAVAGSLCILVLRSMSIFQKKKNKKIGGKWGLVLLLDGIIVFYFVVFPPPINKRNLNRNRIRVDQIFIVFVFRCDTIISFISLSYDRSPFFRPCYRGNPKINENNSISVLKIPENRNDVYGY